MHLSLLLPNFFPVQSMFTVNSAAVYCTVLCVPQRHIYSCTSIHALPALHTYISTVFLRWVKGSKFPVQIPACKRLIYLTLCIFS